MDELWTRIAIIATALLVAALVVAVRRRKALNSPRALSATGLEPGIYLFTSADCADCSTARVKLEEIVGPEGFLEIAWEQRPEVFGRLSVEAVPATMVVEADGRGQLWL
ncbi:MAG: hypothetical protein ACRDVL_03520, partial [Acidimicrobiia bacterium]